MFICRYPGIGCYLESLLPTSSSTRPNLASSSRADDFSFNTLDSQKSISPIL